ncbi:MAG: Maf family protein [Neptuniibacter sp.]
MTEHVDLILASASPRRKELLSQIGVRFQVQPVSICEDVQGDEGASDYVLRLAIEKAQTCFRQSTELLPVLGSDTTVVFEGEILGKPVDESEAVKTLMKLSGGSHEVLTAIAVVNAEQTLYSVVKTLVKFKRLTPKICSQYWETGEPEDKAGSYGIQGLGAVFVEEIQGSYSSVVGLPLCETADFLQRVGIDIWHKDVV